MSLYSSCSATPGKHWRRKGFANRTEQQSDEDNALRKTQDRQHPSGVSPDGTLGLVGQSADSAPPEPSLVVPKTEPEEQESK